MHKDRKFSENVMAALAVKSFAILILN